MAAGGVFPPSLGSQQVYKDPVRSFGTAAFSRPEDVNQPITVCRHRSNMVYITELQVSMNYDEEQTLLQQQFKQTNIQMSTTGSGDPIFLWYKEGSNNGITRIQFSYTNKMAENLEASLYRKVNKNLNTSGSGDPVFLWFLNGTGEHQIPIQKIEVSTADIPGKFREGWERQSFNLNRKNGREHAFLWMKREKTTYIHQMLICDSYDHDVTLFRAGYIRVDESTNRSAEGKPVFLWYLPRTKAEGSYVVLQVSIKIESYCGDCILVAPPVNLNKGNSEKKVNLLHKQGDSGQKPIQGLVLIYDEKRKSEYKSAGVVFLDENLNSGKGSPCFPATPLYLGYYQ